MSDEKRSMADRGGERPGQLRGLRADRRHRPERARRRERARPGRRGRLRRHRPRPRRIPRLRRRARRGAGRAAASAWRARTWSCRTPTRTRWRRPSRTRRPPRHVRRGAVLPAGPPPRPTLADNGSKRRAMLPARSVRDPSLGYDADGWRRFAAGLARVLARCRDRGYEPTFHPETGTHVEAPWEIERVLEVSDVGLCLETGHMLLGGGDPVAMLRDLGDRVNHVHLKDARLAVMNEIVTDQAPVTEIWTREAFCALGGGDLDVDAVLAGLRTISFGGWLVVEQDILPRGAERGSRGPPPSSSTTARSWPNGGCACAVPARPGRRGPDGPHPPARAGRLGPGGGDRDRGDGGGGPAAVAAPGVTLHASVAEMLDGGRDRRRAHRRAHRPARRRHRRGRRARAADLVRETVRADRRGRPARRPPTAAAAGCRCRWPTGAGSSRACSGCRRGSPRASSALFTWSPATSGTSSRRRRRSGRTAAGSRSTWACTSSTSSAG